MVAKSKWIACPDGSVPNCHLGITNALKLIALIFVSCLLMRIGQNDLVFSHPLEIPESIQLFHNHSEIDQSKVVRIILVGDVMLGRGVSEVHDPFEWVAKAISQADLAVGNFEGVIGDAYFDVVYQENIISGRQRIVAPSNAARKLQRAGFDVMNLANNHAMDFGSDGLQATAIQLQRFGIHTVGTGSSAKKASSPIRFDLKGVRIAIFGVNAIVAPEDDELVLDKGTWQIADWNRDQLLKAIKEWRGLVDMVIVLLHWGDEYERRSGVLQREIAAELVSEGADLVVGTHPHVVQETQVIESHSDKYAFIAYSLGNFVFDQFEDRTREGLALEVLVDRSGLRVVNALPVVAGPKPRWKDPTQSQGMIERIRPEPKWMGYRCQTHFCTNVIPPEEIRTGLFQSGQIDLNGDGNPEIVRLENGKLNIFEDGEVVWENPDDWQIRDVALGDPNNDGRGEVLVALLKPDHTGKLASHPFIIGHRGGIYRLIWGGSPVFNPIREVELADLDQDGNQELIVIDEATALTQTVTVWRWEEWYFTQVWRSLPGQYRELQVISLKELGEVIVFAEDW